MHKAYLQAVGPCLSGGLGLATIAPFSWKLPKTGGLRAASLAPTGRELACNRQSPQTPQSWVAQDAEPRHKYVQYLKPQLASSLLEPHRLTTDSADITDHSPSLPVTHSYIHSIPAATTMRSSTKLQLALATFAGVGAAFDLPDNLRAIYDEHKVRSTSVPCSSWVGTK